MEINIPTLLTLLRIVAVPFLVLIFYLPFSSAKVIAGIIFIIAALTDWLDGYLARYLKQTTRFGAFLDPVADKLIVSTPLILIISSQPDAFLLAIPAMIIIGREIAVSALREWMAEIGKRASVAVTQIARAKTFMQMIAVTILLVVEPGTSAMWRVLGGILLYIAAILTLWSMVMYLKIAWPDLTLPAEKE